MTAWLYISNTRDLGNCQAKASIDVWRLVLVLSLHQQLMLALVYIFLFVSEKEKNTEMYFYNRTIPIVGHFLIEQSC